MHRIVWTRVALITGLFLFGTAEAIHDWHRHAPVPGLTGAAAYMRNAPGDLNTVLWLYLIEGLAAIAVLQPWRDRPRRRWIAAGALAFGACAVVRWLVGLHSPSVMFGHDVLMLVSALVLAGSVFVLGAVSSPVRQATLITQSLPPR